MTDHPPVVITHPVPLQSGRQFRNFPLGLALGQLCDLARTGLAVQQRLQHQLARHPEQVGEHATQFDIGIFQHLLDTVALTRGIVQKLPTPTREIPSFRDRTRRDETRANHGMAEKRGQPPSILRVGFVPLAAFHIFGVGQHDCEIILQDVEDRLPVTTRTFQDRMRTALTHQPLP
jgi:hypothetical protein